MRNAAFIYAHALSRHVLREDHVMRPTRLVPPRPATVQELGWFHRTDYIEAVRWFNLGESGMAGQRHGFDVLGDNPPYPGMWEAALLSVDGSLEAAQLVADGEADVAFNVAGGLHHAAADHASGFCILTTR